ncbi:MAG: metallopeptidase [marine bacterium B5-7]|nr:MAG: metallopeptidase [marine bacterium B5-7]
MTYAIGGSTPDAEFARLASLARPTSPLDASHYVQRCQRVRELMSIEGIDALFANAGANLEYFTGMRISPSERLLGAIIPAAGDIQYIAPAFERGTVLDYMQLPGELHTWEEHHNPYDLMAEILCGIQVKDGHLAIDPDAPFFLFEGLRKALRGFDFTSGANVVNGCRSRKSAAEIACLQHAKTLTLEVHKSAARILHEGITTTDVTRFINSAHRYAGAPGGSSFCIVLFGGATAFPHGVREPQTLQPGDWVLIDTGCRINGYHSDITRCYAFGSPTARQREAFDIEKEAQAAAFDAAVLGASCEAVDAAARRVLESYGFGPGYTLPGLPHRTGHGCGLQIHEPPYLVRGDRTPLAPGMVFSNEPMLVLPGEFGVRLEDHFYMSDSGPIWFTEPSLSVDDPFASLADDN